MAEVAAKCLNVYTGQFPPYSYYFEYKGRPILQGSIIQVLYILAAHLKFCFKITFQDDWGYKMPNGTWTGMKKDFFDGKVDFAATLFSSKPNLAEILDLHVLVIEPYVISYKAPKLEPSLLGFIKPFSAYVWAGVVGILVVVILFSWMIRHSSAILHGSTVSAVHNLVLSVFLNLRTLLGQSLPEEKKTLNRIMIGLWMLASLIIGTVYKSNLKAMLIIPHIKLPFDNLEQLIDSGIPYKFKTGTHVTLVTKASPPGSLLRRAYDNVAEISEVVNLSQLLLDVANGEFAYFSPIGTMLWAMHLSFRRYRRCDYMIASETLLPMTLSMPISNKLPLQFRTNIKKTLTALQESGILNKIINDGNYAHKNCARTGELASTVLRNMEMKDFYGVFLLYAGGVLLAFLVFVGELVLGRKSRAKDKTATSQAGEDNN